MSIMTFGNLQDPLVIDPPGFEEAAAWQECKEYVDKCGGLSHPDGEPNWRAAFGADPGCCSCPACDQMYWAWGRVQKCKVCCFLFPTDWWAMYSWGGQAARSPQFGSVTRERYYQHSKYYRWAFDGKAEPDMDVAKSLPWWTVFPEDRPSPEDIQTIAANLLLMRTELENARERLELLQVCESRSSRHQLHSTQDRVKTLAHMAARIRAMVERTEN